MRKGSRLAIAVGAVLAAGGAAVATAGPASADTVVGVHFKHSNFGGSTRTHLVYGNGYVCTGPTDNVDVQYGGMGSLNDEVSSFRTYAGCWAKLWEHSNFYGATFGYSGTVNYVGDAMNDRTSSVQYS